MLKAIIAVFFERVSPGGCFRWWHGRAYYDAYRDHVVAVIYPLHLLVNFAWWLNFKWAEHRGSASWIDRKLSEMRERDITDGW